MNLLCVLSPGLAMSFVTTAMEIDPFVHDRTIEKSQSVIFGMVSDEKQSWFSDGLTEEILNALARTPDLLVAALTRG